MVLPLAMGAAGAGIGAAAALRKGINDYTKKEIRANQPKAGPKGYKKKVKEFEYGMDTLVKGPKKPKPKYKTKGGMSKYYADGGYIITGRD